MGADSGKIEIKHKEKTIYTFDFKFTDVAKSQVTREFNIPSLEGPLAGDLANIKKEILLSMKFDIAPKSIGESPKSTILPMKDLSF